MSDYLSNPPDTRYPPIPPQEGYNAPAGYIAYASWGERLVATFVDAIVVGIPTLVLDLVIRHHSGVAGNVLLSLIYSSALLGSVGWTVGNAAAGTKVVLAADLSQIGYGRAVMRWLVMVVLYATVIGAVLDGLWPLWDRRNQTLHDKAASTFVIQVPRCWSPSAAGQTAEAPRAMPRGKDAND